ncbi:MAG: hypothetical protein OXH10_02695 [bacterium]|nr:hypothetical protein [bacterium]MDE0643143.1 hypothetical protein [bacterium]
MMENVITGLLGGAFIGVLGFLLRNMVNTMTEIRNDIRVVRDEIKDVRGEIKDVRDEIGEVRDELKGEIKEVRGEIKEVHTEIVGIKERLTRIEETQKNHTKLLDGMKDHGERIATLEGILTSPPKK